jgi:hypothetical protein
MIHGIVASHRNVLTDPFFSNVSLLLHMDGANGSTTFSDSSSIPKTVSRLGNTQISTVQSKFGGGSAYFDGVGDSLTTPSNIDLAISGTSYTAEMWFYPLSVPTAIATQPKYLIRKLGAGIVLNDFTKGHVIATSWDSTNSRARLFFQMGTGSADVIAFGTSTIIPNNWYHVAAVWDTSIMRLFVNGVLETSVNNTLSSDLGGVLHIGVDPNNATRDYNGYIDELRITKGIARYTENFTPPTAPFPDA